MKRMKDRKGDFGSKNVCFFLLEKRLVLKEKVLKSLPEALLDPVNDPRVGIFFPNKFRTRCFKHLVLKHLILG